MDNWHHDSGATSSSSRREEVVSSAMSGLASVAVPATATMTAAAILMTLGMIDKQFAAIIISSGGIGGFLIYAASGLFGE